MLLLWSIFFFLSLFLLLFLLPSSGTERSLALTDSEQEMTANSNQATTNSRRTIPGTHS